MRLRGAGGPPFAAGRVLAGARPRTAALRADRAAHDRRRSGPGGGWPSSARGAAAWVRTDADDGRGAVVCPLIGATRLRAGYMKFCSPVTSAPLYDDTRCGVHRYASRTGANPTRHSD